MAKKKVTLQTIADKLEFSKSLVSKALSNNPGVSEETRERIKKVARDLGYRINSSVQSIPNAETGNIALMIPRQDLEDLDYWGKIIRAIEYELSKNGFSLILAPVETDYDSNYQLPISILDRKVDGVIVLGRVSERYIIEMQSMHLPIVLVDYPSYKFKLDHILADNFSGGYEATKYLLDLGHHNIAFVGDNRYALSFSERLRGFLTAITDYQSEFNVDITYQTLCDPQDKEPPYSQQQLASFLSKNERTTALFCANDPIAFHLLPMLKKYGLSVPENISIMSFDNIDKCEWILPALSSVDISKTSIGRRAVHLLMRRMKYMKARTETILLSTELKIRSSIIKINNKSTLKAT